MTEKKDYMTDGFYKRYKNSIEYDECSVLSMLDNCNGNIQKVSTKIGYGLYYIDLVNLCAGYVYGDETLKQSISDLLEDINYHYECAELEDNTDNFIRQVLDVNSDYSLKFFS